jgi:hypothetical protein
VKKSRLWLGWGGGKGKKKGRGEISQREEGDLD